jgi:hypothetical protein
MAISTSNTVFPLSSAYLIATTATSANVTVSSGNTCVYNVLVENLDATNDVFVNWGLNGSATVATVPTAGNPQRGVAVQANGSKVINIASGSYNGNVTVAATAITGTANVLVIAVA